MKFSEYILFFFIGFLCIFAILNYRTSLNEYGSIIETKYTSYITAACEDAMKTVTDYEDEGVFTTEKKRENAFNAFYKSLTLSFNAKNTTVEDTIPFQVPAICLIDNGGYYIRYLDITVDSTGYKVITPITTTLNTWGETVEVPSGSGQGTYFIRYYLNNQISITNQETGEYKSGDPNSVWEYFKAPEELNFLDVSTEENKKAFYTHKANIITNKTQSDLEYYINEYNNTLDKYGMQYTFEIPEIKGEDWQRALEGPTILGFLQGSQTQNGLKTINIYAMAGAEVKRTNRFLLTSDMYYHKDSTCPGINEGNFEGYAYSDTSAASQSYFPCQYCVDY